MIKSKVVKFSKDRKIVEIPKTYRNDFEIGDSVLIQKEKKEEFL